jgi:hypothetical protein
VALTWLEVWPFTEGSGTTVNEVLTGAPDLQGFGTNGTWSEDGAGAGDGWGWTNQFLAAPNVTGNAIDGLNGATQATLIVAFKTGTTLPGNGEIVAEIGQDESPNTNQRFGFGFQGSGSDELRARVNNATVISHASPIFSSNTWYVCVFVYDSPNATAADRARFWVNGTRIGTIGAIIQNATMTFASGTDEIKFGVPFASTNGRVFWAAFASGAASDAEVATITSALGADNDITNPLAGGGTTDAAGTSSIVVTASGVGSSTAAAAGTSASTLSVSATGTAVTQSAGTSTVAVSASGVGSSTAASAGTTSAAVAVAGSGSSVAASAGSSSVAITSAGSGASTMAGAGSAAITLSASGAASSVAAGVGSASVTLAGSGVGQTLSDGSAVGVSSVSVSASGSGSSVAASAGTSSASLSASAQGTGVAAAAGTSAIVVASSGAGTGIAESA